MKKILLVTLVLTMMVFYAMDVYAGCGGCDPAFSEDQKAKGPEIINSICPVMGGEVSKDTPYRTEYKGQKIGFCCASCVDEFKADPEKYNKIQL